MLSGLELLHSNMIIHRDLKLNNVFIDEDMNMRIGDLGMAVKLKSKHERRDSICGTPNYLAPEMVSSVAFGGHSFEVDIWAVGVMAYLMLYGRHPFDHKDINEMYKKIRAVDYELPEVELSSEAKNFITSILLYEPSLRPSLSDLLGHPFL